MKRPIKLFSIFVSLLTIFISEKLYSQTIDTLIDVGGYKLHFHIIKGQGTPILFEAGGGDNGTVWNDLLKPLANITGTTLISYDRAGFGKSTLDTNKHGILNGIIGLETALHKLGYDGNILLVSHSQGGFYSTLYAYRHPTKVKAAVLIDASTSCWFNDNRLAVIQHSNDIDREKFKETRPGLYYQFGDLSSNVNFIKTKLFPTSIPVIDFVSENPPFDDTVDINNWKLCHQEFVSGSSNRIGITAYGCGHYIFEDNPTLVVNAIAKEYSATLESNQKSKILTKAITYSTDATNETKKKETLYRHSEDDLNSWGYALLNKGKMQEALEVFKLNVMLNPNSWNVYDSYGETLLKNGQKEEAIKMYEKSVELNPKNENGKKVLEGLNKQ
ncbi:MAG TPA: alpha/beta fold hydrolase [Puia sp.]|nr:alpha/beta fold hydrolase [Puia sp.]